LDVGNGIPLRPVTLKLATWFELLLVPEATRDICTKPAVKFRITFWTDNTHIIAET